MLGIIFLLVFGCFYFISNVVIGIYIIPWTNPESLIFFFLFSLSNIGFSFDLTELIFSLILPKYDLPKLQELNQQPTVALLYVTCNDYIPELVEKLDQQTYNNFNVFILDDSDDKKIQQEIDKYKFKVIRRGTREGAKAGNLNNWIQLFGSKYKYFLVVDADSLLPNNCLENMIKYAEHPQNNKVVLFQSKLKIWNQNNSFPRIMSSLNSLQIYIWERILNRTNMTPLGNNCLYRTDVLYNIGGFIEDFAAEDLATGIKLIENGYQCKLIDVVSYESTPESIKIYSKRSIRWASQTLEVILKNEGNIPLITKLYILNFVYKSLSWFYILPFMILAIWSYKSSFSDLMYFLHIIFTGEVKNTYFFMPLIIILIYWFIFLFGRLPLIYKTKTSLLKYYQYLFVNLGIEFYQIFPNIWSMIGVFRGAKVKFHVTYKRKINAKFSEILRDMSLSLLFLFFIIIGIFRNPISLLFNIIWILPWCFSPFILYKLQTK